AFHETERLRRRGPDVDALSDLRRSRGESERSAPLRENGARPADFRSDAIGVLRVAAQETEPQGRVPDEARIFERREEGREHVLSDSVDRRRKSRHLRLKGSVSAKGVMPVQKYLRRDLARDLAGMIGVKQRNEPLALLADPRAKPLEENGRLKASAVRR